MKKKLQPFFFLSKMKNKQLFVAAKEKMKMKNQKCLVLVGMLCKNVSTFVFCFIFKCVCVFIFILNFFLRLCFFYDTGFLDSFQFEPRVGSLRLWCSLGVPELTVIDLWSFLPLTWPFDLCVAMLRSLCGSQFHKDSTGETELSACDSAVRAKNVTFFYDFFI